MINLQCNKCGKLKNIQVPVDLPMDECIALYVKHIKAEHPFEKLDTMVHENYYKKASDFYKIV